MNGHPRTVLLQRLNHAAGNLCQGLLDVWFGPCQVVVFFRHTFGDAFIDKLADRVLGRCKIATGHMPVEPSLLFCRERYSHTANLA